MTCPRLMFTLTCLMLVQVDCLRADCGKDQYSRNGRCCNLCQPGHFVKRHCSEKQQTVCDPCSQGTYTDVSDDLEHCRKCRVCQQVTLRECSTTLNSNCSCHEGFLCTSSECVNCEEKEICPRGHELTKIGAFLFAYHCQPCSDGMYSDTDGGVCKPLKRCDQLGLETQFPGNKTHNSICHMPVSGPDKASVNTEVTLVVILVLCVFTSLVVLVKTCLPTTTCRKQKRLTKPMKVIPSMTVDLPDETLDLSKEEKGNKPVQEIDKHPSLTSLMTQ